MAAAAAAWRKGQGFLHSTQITQPVMELLEARATSLLMETLPVARAEAIPGLKMAVALEMEVTAMGAMAAEAPLPAV